MRPPIPDRPGGAPKPEDLKQHPQNQKTLTSTPNQGNGVPCVALFCYLDTGKTRSTLILFALFIVLERRGSNNFWFFLRRSRGRFRPLPTILDLVYLLFLVYLADPFPNSFFSGHRDLLRTGPRAPRISVITRGRQELASMDAGGA